MLRQRLITAAIGLPVFLLITWFGNPWFIAAVAIVATLGSLEFFRITISPKIEPLTYFAIIVTVILSISPLYSTLTKSIVFVCFIIASLSWLLFLPNKEGSFLKWVWLLGGTVYLGWMLSYWGELRSLANGREWAYLSIFIIMASDTSAYFIGKAWGRHRMAPSISPKKTWEGAIAGLIFGVLTFVAAKYLVLPYLSIANSIVCGGIVGVFGQIGDLSESLLKRDARVKDSSQFIPGHGGVLDRFDSLAFVAPLVFFYLDFIVFS